MRAFVNNGRGYGVGDRRSQDDIVVRWRRLVAEAVHVGEKLVRREMQSILQGSLAHAFMPLLHIRFLVETRHYKPRRPSSALFASTIYPRCPSLPCRLAYHALDAETSKKKVAASHFFASGKITQSFLLHQNSLKRKLVPVETQSSSW